MKQLLINFLREKNLLITFLVYMSDTGLTLSQLCKKYPSTCWITEAFNWRLTPQGEDIWDGLDMQFDDMLDEEYDRLGAKKIAFTPKQSKGMTDRTADEIKFIEFLKENNALIPLCTAINRAKSNHSHITGTLAVKGATKGEPLNLTLSEYLKNTEPEQWCNGFYWLESGPEGLWYWDNIHERWTFL